MPSIPDITKQLEQLREYLEILREIKRLQDEGGCPCDPAHVRNKPDYIARTEARISELETALAEEMLKKSDPRDCPICGPITEGDR